MFLTSLLYSFQGIYYCFNMVIIMLSIFLSSLVVNISRAGQDKRILPRWLRLVSLKYNFKIVHFRFNALSFQWLSIVRPIVLWLLHIYLLPLFSSIEFPIFAFFSWFLKDLPEWSVCMEGLSNSPLLSDFRHKTINLTTKRKLCFHQPNRTQWNWRQLTTMHTLDRHMRSRSKEI